jgi:hypothetical protein
MKIFTRRQLRPSCFVFVSSGSSTLTVTMVTIPKVISNKTVLTGYGLFNMSQGCSLLSLFGITASLVSIDKGYRYSWQTVLATMLAQAIGDDSKPSCTVSMKASPRLCLLFVLDHCPVFAPLGVAHVVYISFQIYIHPQLLTLFDKRNIVLYLLHFFFFRLVQSGQRSSSLFKSGECDRELA